MSDLPGRHAYRPGPSWGSNGLMEIPLYRSRRGLLQSEPFRILRFECLVSSVPFREFRFVCSVSYVPFLVFRFVCSPSYVTFRVFRCVSTTGWRQWAASRAKSTRLNPGLDGFEPKATSLP